MELNYKVTVPYQTINQILRTYFHISLRLLHKLISNNLIYLNHSICNTNTIALVGDVITVDLSYSEDNSNIVPTKMDLNIIYEDEGFLILNKPSGIPTHPSILHYSNSLSNGVKYYFDSINLHKKIRPVNRLDSFTSGLIVFAKNEYIQECLIKQMESKTFRKEYSAIINGKLDQKYGTINKPIARKEGSIIERCINEKGKESITHYKVIKEFSKYSLVKCILETGRTHQIRVHFASIGHSLLGESLYDKSSDSESGQALMCTGLSFIHPINKKTMNFQISSENLLLEYSDFLIN